ncbi:Transposase [Fusarium oxysporum f. sp. albedinis]|nr:Transposase [Fusarium oxysporum f. sp. albedinis]
MNGPCETKERLSTLLQKFNSAAFYYKMKWQQLLRSHMLQAIDQGNLSLGFTNVPIIRSLSSSTDGL